MVTGLPTVPFLSGIKLFKSMLALFGLLKGLDIKDLGHLSLEVI